MGESINNSGADAETGKRAWAGHVCNFGEVVPVFVVCSEFVVDKGEEFFG